MEEFLEKKREWKLDGSSEEYDFLLGCYGNPNSNTVFVAEIPSSSGLEIANHLYKPDERWKSAWKISTGDLIYRICLNNYGLIKPDPLSDDPSAWECWLTDFVKCPHRDKTWKAMKKNDRENILSESAEILRKELEIIRPENVIIVGKSKTRPLFDKYMKNWMRSWKDKKHKIEYIDHYARAKSLDPSEPFVKHFDDAMKQINRVRKIP